MLSLVIQADCGIFNLSNFSWFCFDFSYISFYFSADYISMYWFVFHFVDLYSMQVASIVYYYLPSNDTMSLFQKVDFDTLFSIIIL